MLLSDSKASSQFIMNAVHKENIVLKVQGPNYILMHMLQILYLLFCLLVKRAKGKLTMFQTNIAILRYVLLRKH